MLTTTFSWRNWLLLGLAWLAGLTATQAQRLAASSDYTLSIHPDGTLWAWGAGRLGLGTYGYQLTPQQVGTATTWASVSAADSHAVAIRTDGTLWAWGSNIALPTASTVPMQLGTATNWRLASANSTYTVALKTDGTLWSWGFNSAGELGNGTTTSQTTPTQVGTAATWQSVSAGNGYVLAVKTDGTLWAWGTNSVGQLGDGTTTQRLTPTQVGTATTWASVSAGYGRSLAVKTDGTLWAWGDATYEEYNLGYAPAPQLVPAQVGAATNWQSVSAGYLFSLALRTDGTLWAWGYNRWGQLGLGTTASQPAPVQVGAGSTWQSVSVGRTHAVALRTDNSCWAWGGNYIGQLGLGTGGPQLLPAQLNSTPTWRSVAVGFMQVLGIRTDGSLWAWGQNLGGQLGNGTQSDQDVPVPVGSSTASWQSVTTSGLTSLGIRADGTLWSWGRNSYGQLGTGAALTTVATAPVQVGTATWRSVSTLAGHVLAVQTDGSLWAWGNNANGQLGTGSPNQVESSPVRVGTAAWQSVSAGVFHSVAIRADGTLWAWGQNYNGVLGTGSTSFSVQPTPTQVGTASTWASLSASVYHTLAVRTDGTLWSWGSNGTSQLGYALTTYYQATPAQVGTATTWTGAAAGPQSSLAWRQDGSLWVWGATDYGALGIGAVSPNATLDVPTRQGTATWQSAGLGTYYGAGIRLDGTLWTWGYNDRGQLGNGLPGAATPRYVPGGGAVLAATAASTAPTWALVPNPAREQVQLLGLPAGPVAVQVFDAQGHLVRTGQAATVPTQGLAPGLYLVRATAGLATRTLRLVVE